MTGLRSRAGTPRSARPSTGSWTRRHARSSASCSVRAASSSPMRSRTTPSFGPRASPSWRYRSPSSGRCPERAGRDELAERRRASHSSAWLAGLSTWSTCTCFRSVAPSPLDLLTGTVASKRGGTPMHQRQPRHLRSGAALASVLTLVGILGLAPRAAHAQGQCATEFQDQTRGTVADGGTICATALGHKCTFQLDLCVNQSGASCTPKDLKMRTIHAAGLCAGGIGKVKVKANGTSSACGNPAGVKVKTKKHGTKAGSCRIRAKAGQSRSTITLLCQPESSPCSGTTTTTTTIPCSCNTSSFTRLSFTTGIGSGNCGTVQLSNGNVSKNLTCGGLYTGGGSNSVPLPYAVPDMGSSLTALTPGSGTTLTLATVQSGDPG